jgi:hypothetical protein
MKIIKLCCFWIKRYPWMKCIHHLSIHIDFFFKSRSFNILKLGKSTIMKPTTLRFWQYRHFGIVSQTFFSKINRCFNKNDLFFVIDMVVYLYGYWKYFLRDKTSWMLNGWIYIWFNMSKFILLYVFLYNGIAKNYHDQNNL